MLMELPRNDFKHRLAAGEIQYGLWLGLPNPCVAEIAAGAGFEWLLIDHEHAPFELSDILSHLQVMAAYPVSPVVRPASDDPILLKKLLDMGVQSFLVPMVESGAQAEAIACALRYPPEGVRGLGTSLARAARWNQVPDYLARANEEICLVVQVETSAGMEALDDILAVDGVDGVFIGPSDLSASMGHTGNPGHPEVVDAIQRGLDRITAAGRAAGIMSLDPAAACDYRDRGATFLGIGVDTLLLASGARALRGQFSS